MRVTLAEVRAATGGALEPGTAAAVVVDGISNDSRTISAGQCFVAIVDQRDGHDFVGDAFVRGAAAAIVDHRPIDVEPTAPLIVVEHPQAAIAALACWARRERLGGARVIGVTGSTGKTSTKDFLRSVLATDRRVHANEASFNNEIGLPVTVLGAPDDVEVVVCEMGARFAGNIAELCRIAAPDIAVITNIGTAHSEFLDGPEGVLAVKGELLEAIPADGLAVLPADDATLEQLRAATAARVLSAGRSPAADVRCEVVDLDTELVARVRFDTPWGSFESRLGLRGAHQATNAALAAAVALDLGIDPGRVAIGLEAAAGSAWRMELSHTVDGIVVLNDAYNANPQSMRAALEALRGLDPGRRRVAVLGAMRELGPTSASEHVAIGKALAPVGVDLLVAVGDDDDIARLASSALAEGVEVETVPDAESAITALARHDLGAGDAVLVKASRAVGLDRVAAALLSRSDANLGDVRS